MVTLAPKEIIFYAKNYLNTITIYNTLVHVSNIF